MRAERASSDVVSLLMTSSSFESSVTCRVRRGFGVFFSFASDVKVLLILEICCFSSSPFVCILVVTLSSVVSFLLSLFTVVIPVETGTSNLVTSLTLLRVDWLSDRPVRFLLRNVSRMSDVTVPCAIVAFMSFAAERGSHVTGGSVLTGVVDVTSDDVTLFFPVSFSLEVITKESTSFLFCCTYEFFSELKDDVTDLTSCLVDDHGFGCNVDVSNLFIRVRKASSLTMFGRVTSFFELATSFESRPEVEFVADVAVFVGGGCGCDKPCFPEVDEFL